MKKTPDKELLPEYDFSKGVRGKYAARVTQGSNVVVLDKDVQSLFPDSAAVNSALRASSSSRGPRAGRRGAATAARRSTPRRGR